MNNNTELLGKIYPEQERAQLEYEDKKESILSDDIVKPLVSSLALVVLLQAVRWFAKRK